MCARQKILFEIHFHLGLRGNAEWVRITEVETLLKCQVLAQMYEPYKTEKCRLSQNKGPGHRAQQVEQQFKERPEP